MNETKRYNLELIKAMNWLSEHSNTLFLGQAVKYAGTGMFDSLIDIPDQKKLEFPVAENFQMGYSLGLALNGIYPVSIYPRWNFLLCAADQLVNHVDKIYWMSSGVSQPKMIIRVAKGTEIPVDPQDQHKGDFTDAFRKIFKYIDIIQLQRPEDILNSYKHAYYSPGVTILVEYPDYGK